MVSECHCGIHPQVGRWRRGVACGMRLAGTASCFPRSRATAKPTRGGRTTTDRRHPKKCRCSTSPISPATSVQAATWRRRSCTSVRCARCGPCGAEGSPLRTDERGSGSRATRRRCRRVWWPGAGPRAMEGRFSPFRQAAGSADRGDLLRWRGGMPVARKAGKGVREAERAGRPVQEAGRTYPGIQQRAADRNAQDDQAPEHLVPTADTWAMDEIAHRVEHQRVLCRSKANDHRGEQERLQGHGARSSGRRSGRNHFRLRRDPAAPDKHDQITCSGERVICTQYAQYRGEASTPRLYVRGWSIIPRARRSPGPRSRSLRIRSPRPGTRSIRPRSVSPRSPPVPCRATTWPRSRRRPMAPPGDSRTIP